VIAESGDDGYYASLLWNVSFRKLNIVTLTGAKIEIFDRYMALASITAGLSRIVNISTVE